MALFRRKNNYVRKVVLIEFPEILEKLRILCRSDKHPLPVLRSLIGKGTSHHGEPMSIYGCPLCGMRSGHILDRKTRRVVQLWEGMPKQ
ncbi:MAG: hypothetical protein QY317_16495 [Candidatus Jettenia caeni]|nr:MAG: hypothetical protein QY317_16495 [Candidatus Jettenia caeni]